MVKTREDWLGLMLKTAQPVLESLKDRRLNKVLMVSPDRAPYACLEAFGRIMTGIAPWLELDGLEGSEAETQKIWRDLAIECIDAATDPRSPDFMNFDQGYGQSLVDAAFLAHSIVRAPVRLCENLDPRVRANLSAALKSTRKFTPYESNWLLFPAMVEAALLLIEGECDPAPVRRAAEAFERWYVGDGHYGDGEYFHFDYYNSFVIHPMYVDILRVFENKDGFYAELLPKAKRREARYAAVLERLIAPDGTYPVAGRSVCYRYGAFHALAHAALIKNLPENLPPEQVRCAMSAVFERTLADGIFNENGLLKTGIVGSQPSLAEGYICTGSLYLCEAAFLPLGLSPAERFWSGGEADWTSKKIWSGENLPADHAED